MDSESPNDQIIYRGTSGEQVEINPGTGRYECRVRNDLGTTTKFIVLHPLSLCLHLRPIDESDGKLCVSGLK